MAHATAQADAADERRKRKLATELESAPDSERLGLTPGALAASDPGSPSQRLNGTTVLGIQRTMGNRAFQRIMATRDGHPGHAPRSVAGAVQRRPDPPGQGQTGDEELPPVATADVAKSSDAPADDPPADDGQDQPRVEDAGAGGLPVRRSVDAVPGTIRRKPPSPGTAALPGRAEVEGLRNRAVQMQNRLSGFIDGGKARVAEVRNFWTALNGVYARCHANYSVVLGQAAAAARQEEAIVNVFVGTGLGIFADVVLPSVIITTAIRQVVSEVTPSLAQIPIQYKTASSEAAPLLAQNPVFKQLQAVSELDKLQSILLDIATPALALSNIALAAEHIIGELRVADAKGAREMTDAQIRETITKLSDAVTKLAALEEQIKAAEEKFAALKKHFDGLRVPSDKETEQDLWIEWIVAAGSPPYALNNRVIANHLRDIELSGGASDLPYGRLAVNFGRWITTWDLDAAYKGASSELPNIKKSWQRYFGVVAE